MKLHYHLTAKELHRYLMDEFIWLVTPLILILIISLQSLDVSWLSTVIGVVSFVLIVVLCYALFLWILSHWCKPAVIEITADGICKTMNGKVKNWTWQDVGSLTLNQDYFTLQLNGSMVIIPLKQVNIAEAVAFYQTVRERMNVKSS